MVTALGRDQKGDDARKRIDDVEIQDFFDFLSEEQSSLAMVAPPLF